MKFPLWHGKVATSLQRSANTFGMPRFRFGMVKLQRVLSRVRSVLLSGFRFGMVKLQLYGHLGKQMWAYVSALAW